MGRILGVGELLWDLEGERRTPGGAPANFAFSAGQLGHEARVVSRVGEDTLGAELLAFLRSRGLDVATIQTDPDKPTGTVLVELDEDGSPTFTITEEVAWDYLSADDEAVALARSADAICFGSLGQRNPVARAAIRTLVDAGDGLRIFDINLRQHFWSKNILRWGLQRAAVVKLNAEEQRTLADVFEWPAEPVAWARRLSGAYGTRVVCITRGADGCVLVSPDDVAEAPGKDIEVADTVGAGDAFTAAIADGMLRSLPLSAMARRANRVAAYVASRSGGMAELPSGIGSD